MGQGAKPETDLREIEPESKCSIVVGRGACTCHIPGNDAAWLDGGSLEQVCFSRCSQWLRSRVRGGSTSSTAKPGTRSLAAWWSMATRSYETQTSGSPCFQAETAFVTPSTACHSRLPEWQQSWRPIVPVR